MLPLTVLLLNLGWLLSGAVIVDRVAVVVGRNVIKLSDIDRDLRASAFLNGAPLDFSPDAKRKAAERLIDQELIRQEILAGGYRQPSQQDVDAFLAELQRDRFGGSAAKLHAALSKYGLTEEQLRQYLQWQLTVLRFIDERFRPGVLITEEDVRAYYEEHRAELQKAYPQLRTVEALEPKIREILTGQRVNQNFEDWLNETRRRTRIVYRDAAFQEAEK
jgi:peptidyl-prolyl cis-trans isomerase SurA